MSLGISLKVTSSGRVDLALFTRFVNVCVCVCVILHGKTSHCLRHWHIEKQPLANLISDISNSKITRGSFLKEELLLSRGLNKRHWQQKARMISREKWKWWLGSGMAVLFVFSLTVMKARSGYSYTNTCRTRVWTSTYLVLPSYWNFWSSCEKLNVESLCSNQDHTYIYCVLGPRVSLISHAHAWSPKSKFPQKFQLFALIISLATLTFSVQDKIVCRRFFKSKKSYI